MSMRDKITIIILSYNRPRYLKRSMDFYISYGFNVIVIDGSKKKQVIENKDKKLCYVNLKKSYHERFIYSAKLVKTKYSILVNDDEFFFPEFIDLSINFLEKNKDYVSVCGIVFTFLLKKEEIFFNQGYIYFSDRICKSNTVEERIEHSIHNPSVHGYNSVMRSQIFKGEAQLLSKLKGIKNIFFKELFLNIYITSKGKSKFFNNLAWFRSFENNWIQTKGWNRNTKFQNPYLWIKRQPGKKIKKYAEVLAKEISDKDSLKISKLIHHNLNIYLLEFKKNIYLKLKKKKTILLFIKNKIKGNHLVYNLIKPLFTILKSKKLGFKIYNLEKFMLRKKIFYKKKTLNNIIKIINKFHNK